MDENLLIAQITVLENNITRMTTLLNSAELYRSQYVRGKFQWAINPPKSDLSTLKENVQEKDLTEEQLRWYWKQLQDIKATVQSVFDQCLDYVGGIALRAWKLEDNICDVAETLVQYLNQGGTWGSVAIVGEERSFDDISKKTQLIRLRFPEWGVWSLSFTAYEFGRWIAHQDYVQKLPDFFKDEKEHVKALIETKDPQSLVTAGYLEQSDVAEGKIRNLAPEIDALRQSSLQDEDFAAELTEQLKRYELYLQEFFADAFGTYFLGPAYPYSLLCMRIDPLTALNDTPEKPSLARRMDLTWQLLESMGEKAKETDKFAPNPYDPEIELLKKLWEQTMKMVLPGYEAKFAYGIPYKLLADSLHATLKPTYGSDGFGLKEWEASQKLGQSLIKGSAVDVDVNSLAVVLNAAWFARVRRPDLIDSIERQAYDLMQMISGKPPEVQQQTTAKPGTATRQTVSR